ncbi:hypothetical protein AMAG_08729 [Allomyces macrogynus ATCC 38327]|uniref:Uncharacterized protein n=1 Tax=Allomyces macrogynus (strain ATCC 38327) TaxID=578462 RepID=A0A0L0SM46_ALLM3|nr:hypothetical protein AMAG_08729 [Allomyces macrogynus ATCC 38327]|eukprot:KNE63626.1 hypothetical protein AMAG_08729 [Allomyces macrogynus ATCC 38327]
MAVDIGCVGEQFDLELVGTGVIGMDRTVLPTTSPRAPRATRKGGESLTMRYWQHGWIELLGSTSPPSEPLWCDWDVFTADPIKAWKTPVFSRGVFLLPPGETIFNIRPTGGRVGGGWSDAFMKAGSGPYVDPKVSSGNVRRSEL